MLDKPAADDAPSDSETGVPNPEGKVGEPVDPRGDGDVGDGDGDGDGGGGDGDGDSNRVDNGGDGDNNTNSDDNGGDVGVSDSRGVGDSDHVEDGGGDSGARDDSHEGDSDGGEYDGTGSNFMMYAYGVHVCVYAMILYLSWK